jgi:hypothetical protein
MNVLDGAQWKCLCSHVRAAAPTVSSVGIELSNGFSLTEVAKQAVRRASMRCAIGAFRRRIGAKFGIGDAKCC